MFPQGDVDGDTMVTLGFWFIQDTGILERTTSHLNSLFLKLLGGSFLYANTFVDQMANCDGPAQIDMPNDNKADVGLFHFGFDLVAVFMVPVFWWQTHCKKVDTYAVLGDNAE